ncbi:MAG: hypothetical protein RLP13_01915, partial [Cytophagales bacterium]
MNKLSIVLIAIIGLSCGEAFFDDDPPNNPTTNFEILWKRMDERYSFFDYKKINWDSVYQVYRPQVDDNMTPQELFDVMEAMLNTLKDAHVNLRSDFDVSFYNYHKNAPSNFDFKLLEDAYVFHKRRTSLAKFKKQVFN